MTKIWDIAGAQAGHYPSAIAVQGTKTYTYRQLLSQAANLSSVILDGPGPGTVIAYDGSSSTIATVVVLAASAARCAFLPISTASPKIHRDYIIADSEPGLIVHDAADGGMSVDRRSTDAAACVRQPEDMSNIAYIMYTSGSTGRPKGVMVSHQALTTRLAGLAQVPGMARGESIMALTDLSFDICMAELLLPLTVGGRFVDAPPEARVDPELFSIVVNETRPDIVQATPSFWRLVLAAGWQGLRGGRIWCGGEAMTRELVTALLPRCDELWNLYGPTEMTIWASALHVREANHVHLGNPLPGSGWSLQDETGGTISEGGLAGELILSGAGLAQGYVNQPEFTAQRFGPGETSDGQWKYYRTGDRAQYLGDGSMAFLGRLDSQVKVRGHRIELGEIEAVMEEHPAVTEAVAVVHNADAQHIRIAAYLVTDGTITVKHMRLWLAERIPPAMRPAYLSIRDRLPRTAAGKIDRVGLSANGA